MIQTQKKSIHRPRQSLLDEIARYKLPIPRVFSIIMRPLVYIYEWILVLPTAAHYGHSREENADILCYASETRG